MPNEIQLRSFREAYMASQIAETTTLCPAALSSLQWIIETEWGLHQPNNNCFGIKFYTGATGKQLLATTEWFTFQQAKTFLAGDPHRSASVARDMTGSIIGDGELTKYNVYDWFATFRTLGDCFQKHGELITRSPLYHPFFEHYQYYHCLPALIRDIAPVYAKSPSYADDLIELANEPAIKAIIGSL